MYVTCFGFKARYPCNEYKIESFILLINFLADIKEVKTLIDLAMITASGQGDMEVGKVSTLHAAVTGFAPLIYNLPQDADFTVFYECCNDVWKTMETDEGLVNKLVCLSNQN